MGDEVPRLDADAEHRLHRTIRWALPLLVLMVLAVPAFYVAASLTGPSPRLAQLEKEAVLVAPVPALELGRQTRQSQHGAGLPDVSAYVVVAYQVDTTPQDALAAWFAAYGARYRLEDSSHSPKAMQLWASNGDRYVSVTASDHVDDGGIGGSFSAPAPGSTVVTVLVSGNS